MNKKVKASEQQSPRRSGSLACLVAEAYERGGEEKDATATPSAVVTWWRARPVKTGDRGVAPGPRKQEP